MKKQILFFTLCIAVLLASCSSGSGEYDTRAVESLDKLTETVGKLTSLSYTVQSFEVNKEEKETYKLSDVYLKGPNKMFIENSGTNGTKHFWYNGETFSYFLYGDSEYDTLEAPDNTLKLIDSIHSKYNIYFPAADFLYPTLTDDLLESYDKLLYFGEEEINEVTCIALEATNEDIVVQIWIEKETNLPHKMIIENKNNQVKYYEAEYSNWKIDPNLPDILFEFQPPEGSKRKKF